MVDMNDMIRHRASVVTTGHVIESCPGARCHPSVISIHKHAIRIIWIDSHALVVPVLWIVAAAGRAGGNCLSTGAATLPERAALRSRHIAPGSPGVGAHPNSELASGSVCAACIVVRGDRPDLSIDVIRIAGRICDVHAAELIDGIYVSAIRDALTCLHCFAGSVRTSRHAGTVDDAVIIARYQREVRRASARAHRALIHTIRPILIEVVLTR